MQQTAHRLPMETDVGHGCSLKTNPYLQTVMRFLRSTATFLLDAFFDVRPIAIAVWMQDASIRWSLNTSSREPPTPPFGPKHTIHTPQTPTPQDKLDISHD